MAEQVNPELIETVREALRAGRPVIWTGYKAAMTDTIDKSKWGDGPWQTEPDKVQWKDPATGLDCLAVRSERSGAWCGYVGVPPGHPWYGLDYSAIDADVHGGLTFARGCMADGRVCHVPQEGQSDNVYWVGFDCAHSEDWMPAIEACIRHGMRADPPLHVYQEYRTLAYVQAEVTSLANQAAQNG